MHWLAASLLLVVTPALHAQTISSAPDDVEVTIYRDATDRDDTDFGDDSGDLESFGLAMITETRKVTIPAGRSIIRFLGVADAIVPQTAKLEGLSTPVLERNFDYDLLSPGTLIAKSIGKPVRLIRTDKARGKVTEQVGILRSGPAGVVVEIDGKVEPVGCGGLNERLVFDAAPADLAEKPTLSITVNVPTAGEYSLRLSYLTLGMGWSADYIARLNDDGRTLDLSAWITLSNHLSASFIDAPVKVVAGTLSRDQEETVPPKIREHNRQPMCWLSGPLWTMRTKYAAPMQTMMYADELRRSVVLEEAALAVTVLAKQSELGDYKLYTLPERTTVAAKQTKQVRMIDKTGVPYERVYVQRLLQDDFDAGSEFAPNVVLRLQNRKRSGLGLPLPAGVVSVMEPNARGQLVLAGEQSVQDTPVDLPMEITTGQAMDVWVRPRVLRDETIKSESGNRKRSDIEIGFGNDKTVPIRLELMEALGGYADVRIVSESLKHTKKLGNGLWSFTLQPGERASLRYTIERAD